MDDVTGEGHEDEGGEELREKSVCVAVGRLTADDGFERTCTPRRARLMMFMAAVILLPFEDWLFETLESLRRF